MRDIKSKIPPKTLSLLRKAGLLARQRGEAAYAVGGFVRDLFLGRPSADIDIALEGDGIAFAGDLARLTGSKLEAFTRFGTSIVVVPGFGKVDVATARTESYGSPGALPKVAKGGIAQDLYRRDFTINAMALDLSQDRFLRLLDPFQGLADLRKGRIRALHAKSFEDDPTRVFRAVRFEQRFGKSIEPGTRRWLDRSVRGGFLERVSGERLRNEFRLIFREARPERAVRRLDQLKVLPRVHPSLGVSREAKKALPSIGAALSFFRRHRMGLEEEGMVWFQALLDHPGKAAEDLCRRLALSRSERKIVSQSAAAFPALLPALGRKGLEPSGLYRLLNPLRGEVQCFLMAAASPALRARLSRYYVELRKAEPWVRGRDLRELGIPPGVRYAAILQEALDGQLDGKFKGRRAALDWVRRSFGN